MASELEDSPTPKSDQPRLLVVTNRLPANVKQDESGNYSFTGGAGGLTPALAGLAKSMSFLWYGWPGMEIPEMDQDEITVRVKAEHAGVPVYLDDKVADLYYNKFSNSILWPLFHYSPGEVMFSEEAWQAYQTANRKFAQTLAKDIKEGDLVWVHDYHLMLLPSMLREMLSHKVNFKIGFFFHTTFPSSEIFRILPVRTQILRGVLSSDLIGFHTYDFARHFLSSCWIVLGLQTSTRSVTYQGKVVNVGAFPIGIDPDRFSDMLEDEVVKQRLTALESEFKNKKVFVGVDRLDYVKGIPQKLRAFETFLETHPDWVGRCVLIQVGVPTRADVEQYQNLRASVNELVGRINGKFGSFDYTPIIFMYQSLDFRELIALYALADACIIASTRDGMNLVSFEYVACQSGRHGSLILSEFAGSAQSLDGAIIMNPWNQQEMARAMSRAAAMEGEERAARWWRMAAYVRRYTSAHWGQSFVEELKTAGEEKEVQSYLQVSHDPLSKRVDWCNYDGESGF